LFSPWYSWKIVELALNNIHSFTHYSVKKNVLHEEARKMILKRRGNYFTNLFTHMFFCL
jgi:hypothetical protein